MASVLPVPVARSGSSRPPANCCRSGDSVSEAQALRPGPRRRGGGPSQPWLSSNASKAGRPLAPRLKQVRSKCSLQPGLPFMREPWGSVRSRRSRPRRLTMSSAQSSPSRLFDDPFHSGTARLSGRRRQPGKLWRAVDQDGIGADIWVQSRRDKGAAKRLLRNLSSGCRAPRVMITDKLGHSVASETTPSVEHRKHKGVNNQASNSAPADPPTRAADETVQISRPGTHNSSHMAALHALPSPAAWGGLYGVARSGVISTRPDSLWMQYRSRQKPGKDNGLKNSRHRRRPV